MMAGAASPPDANAPRLQQLLDEGRVFLAQKVGVRHTLPNVTFTDRLTLHLGGREIQVRHDERAVTPGDTYLYLPREKVLITGDLLVNPISFALGCYPTGWLRTLEHLDTLDATILVPGHGEPLRDKRLLHATMEIFRRLLKEGADARARGLDADLAREAILPGLHDLMVQVTGDVPAINDAFRVQLMDWYLHRVYDELSGPLTDAIAPIPPK